MRFQSPGTRVRLGLIEQCRNKKLVLIHSINNDTHAVFRSHSIFSFSSMIIVLFSFFPVRQTNVSKRPAINQENRKIIARVINLRISMIRLEIVPLQIVVVLIQVVKVLSLSLIHGLLFFFFKKSTDVTFRGPVYLPKNRPQQNSQEKKKELTDHIQFEIKPRKETSPGVALALFDR